MSDTEILDIDQIRISSWSAPSEQDFAILERLTDEQFRMLLQREVQKGLDSGVSDMHMADAWQEAMRRMKEKSTKPHAL